jgi:hypothetical protein
VRDFCLLKAGVTVLCVHLVGDIEDGINGGCLNKACSREYGENGLAPVAIGVVGMCACRVCVTGVIATAVSVVGDGATTIGATGFCTIGLWSNGIGHGS